MKNINTILAVTAAVTAYSAANAAVYYSTNFASGYTNGNLVGQNGWTQTGTSTTSPLQVTNGFATVGTSGQDAYAAFATSASATAGTSLYLAASITLTSAQSGGDYFLHVSSPTGTTSNFYGRVAAKSSGSGFVLGISTSSSTFAYGSTVLNFNQSYNVVMSLDFVTGSSNDVASIFIDPNSTDRGTLTAYATANSWGATAEPTSITAVNLRQGNGSVAPSVKVASLTSGDSLAAVGVVPAPGAAALIGLAGLATSRRRR